MCRVLSRFREYSAEAAVLVACAVAAAWLIARGQGKEPEIATFVVLSITLAVLISYARGTNRIARVTLERWERESRPRGRYSMNMADIRKELHRF